MEPGVLVLTIGGGVIVGGILVNYVANKRYTNSRPTVEGEVMETHWSNKQDSTIKIRTENDGDLSLVVGTYESPFAWGIDLGIVQYAGGRGKNYEGKAQDLTRDVKVGSMLKAKVHQKKGLERTVYELLNIRS